MIAVEQGVCHECDGKGCHVEEYATSSAAEDTSERDVLCRGCEGEGSREYRCEDCGGLAGLGIEHRGKYVYYCEGCVDGAAELLCARAS